jgi:hypothetical protein
MSVANPDTILGCKRGGRKRGVRPILPSLPLLPLLPFKQLVQSCRWHREYLKLNRIEGAMGSVMA